MQKGSPTDGRYLQTIAVPVMVPTVRESGNSALQTLLTSIALYGAERAQLKTQIYRPKHGVMPSWNGRLTDAGIKQLAIYVHGLGGGEKAKAE